MGNFNFYRWLDTSKLACWTADPHNWHKNFQNIPEDASTFDGINYKETAP
jgi:hypothetical protein